MKNDHMQSKRFRRDLDEGNCMVGRIANDNDSNFHSFISCPFITDFPMGREKMARNPMNHAKVKVHKVKVLPVHRRGMRVRRS